MSARAEGLGRLTSPAGDVVAWLDAVAEPLLLLVETGGGIRLVHVNEALCQAVQLDRETLLLRGLHAWLDENSVERLCRAAYSAFASGRSRCRDIDSSGAIVELRRVRRRGRDYCLGTLRLATGTSPAPLSRDELKHRAELMRTAMDLEAMVAWTWELHSDELCLEYRAAAAEFVPLAEPRLQAFFERVYPDDRARVTQVVREALRDDRTHQVEFRYVTPTGQLRWISSALKRFLDEQGDPGGLVGASRDVTRRKDVYRELAEGEQWLRTVLDNEPECVKLVDHGYALQMMNPAGLAMIGAERAEQAVGLDVRGLIAPEHRAAFEAFHARVMGGATEVLEFEIIGLRGERRRVESHAAPLRDAQGTIIGQLSVTRDVTESRRLSRSLIEEADREQWRIGRDLHDGLGQDLTGISLMLRGLQGQLNRPQGAVRADIEEIIGLVNRMQQNTRALARGLSPVALEQGGLEQALRQLIARARESGQLGARLSVRSDNLGKLEPGPALQLYRIAQEALTNVLRHAGATRLDVSLADTTAGLRLRIADNGCGLPANSADERGLGLRSMEYRASLMGATLEVVRRPQGGTAVVVTLPTRPGSDGDP